MDSSDLSIIGILLLDSRTSLSAMAKELGISQPAVQKRIRKLKDAGIILGSTVLLNTGKLGWKRAIVALSVKKAAYGRIVASAARLPFVSGVYNATGHYGLVVELLGPGGVVSGAVAHLGKMDGVVDCCQLSIVERIA
jgi:DNA-binding Lrp family transcriptional regulator